MLPTDMTSPSFVEEEGEYRNHRTIVSDTRSASEAHAPGAPGAVRAAVHADVAEI
jgi:hypothetical protein